VTESLGCANLVGRWVALLITKFFVDDEVKGIVLKMQQWLAASLVVGSTLCLVAPARAGELSSWRFDPQTNRLEFKTENDVQPQAQLVTEPTRLVIDLPGTTWSRSQVAEALSGSFKTLRITQADDNTTRITVELAPGYTLDPQQIQFRGISPTQWTVQLPQPQSNPGSTVSSSTVPRSTVSSSTVTQAPSPAPSRPTFSAATPSRSAPAAPDSRTVTNPPEAIDNSLTRVDNIRVTGEGVLVQTEGAAPDVKIEPDENDRRVIIVTLRDAQLANDSLNNQRIDVDRYGIRYVSIEQRSRDRVRVRMVVTRESGDWRTANIDGGIGVFPASRRVSPVSASAPSPVVSQAPPQSAPVAQSAEPVTIQGIGFSDNNSQLLIQSDRTPNASGQWQNGLYQVTLSPARLGDGVTTPQIPSSSPLLRARAYQADDQTVVISLFPKAGTVFSGLTTSSGVIALGMGRSTSASASLQLPNNRPTRPGTDPNGAIPLPNVQSGRYVVVLDPGHGGGDPGAIGINGLREAPTALAIAQQVAAILDQQGVQAVLTRSSDVEIELQPRVDLAEQVNATLFVSIHLNAIDMTRPDVNGTTTYYYSSGEDLAQVIQDAAVQGGGLNDRGIHSARFYVLRRTSMPAVLVGGRPKTGRFGVARADGAGDCQWDFAVLAAGESVIWRLPPFIMRS
jgi:N-acetylmuramoyl-L-alanine amidase